MIIEEGTKADFKHCVLEQIWTWEFACGHLWICDADYQAEYDRLTREGFSCPRCRKPGSNLVFTEITPMDR